MTFPSHPTGDLMCPACHRVNDMAFNPNDGGMLPHDGAVSICIRCSYVSIFTLTGGMLGLRRPTEEEAREIAADERVQEVLGNLMLARATVYEE